MAYSQTSEVVDGVTDIEASQYNNLRAEVKAAAEGQTLHANGIALSYTSNKLSTVTITDPDGSTSTDVDCVTTITWTGSKPTSIVTVYSRLSRTVTETLTWTGNNCTAVSRAIT